MKIGIISFVQHAHVLIDKIVQNNNHEYVTYQHNQRHAGASAKVSPAKSWLTKNFSRLDAFVFIGAIPIATRLIAPFIVKKDTDPAIVCIDILGRFVVPILGGHLGGANALANELSQILGATPVITTATDCLDVFAVDLWCKANNCAIADTSKIKHVSSALLKGEKVGFFADVAETAPAVLSLASALAGTGNYSPKTASPAHVSSPHCTQPNKCDLYQPHASATLNTLPEALPDVGICVSLNPLNKPFATTFNAVPRIVNIGVGCKKGAVGLEEFVLAELDRLNISPLAISTISTIDLKSNEAVIVEFAQKYGRLISYSVEVLREVKGNFTGSKFVESIVGVDNVCERCAILSSDYGELVLKKTCNNGITIAIALDREAFKNCRKPELS